MKYIFLTIIVCGLFIGFVKCNKNLCEGGNSMDYEFDLPFHIAPVADTIHLGDTLWVESSFDAELLNKINGKKYSVAGNHQFIIYFNINDLMLNNIVPMPDYYVVDSLGNYLPNTNPDGDNVNTILFSYKDGKCYWKRGY